MQHETRIITRPRGDGGTEISVYEPARGREHRSGLVAPPGQEEATVRQLKETLERAGNRVSHKEIRSG